MKRLTAFILTGILALNLTACGGGGKSQESSSQPSKETTSQPEVKSNYPEKPITIMAPAGAGCLQLNSKTFLPIKSKGWMRNT